MIKVTLLYPRPEDPAAFNRHYRDVHIPLASDLPDLVRLEAAEVTDPQSDYHLVAELWYPDLAAMGASMGSDHAKRVAEDVANFSKEPATAIVSEVWDTGSGEGG